MAITYPLNLLDDFPGWSTDFSLMYRQEQSRHASGRTRVKDFGTPIWQANYSTKTLSANNLDIWRAKLNSLENGLQTFMAYPTSRCRPIFYPGNSLINSGTVHTINSNRKAIRVDGLNFGFRLSIGDYLRIGNTLHQVVENTTANSVTGLTQLFEIRPHLPSSTAVGNAVILEKPYVLMTIVPGSVTSVSALNTGRGSISFQAIEARG